MTRHDKRKLMKVLAAGTITLAGAAGAVLLPRDSRRKLARHFTRDKAAKLAVFAAFGGLMYVKGRILPKYADDYPYSFKWDPKYGNLTEAGQKLERVRTLKDLVESQVAHYKTWDGRVLVDFVVQLVLMKDDKKTFDVVNTLVMLAQLLVCGSIAKGKRAGLKDLSLREVVLLTTGFWTCTPHLIATCFWLTGSITYLWSGLVESLYVLPLMKLHITSTYLADNSSFFFMSSSFSFRRFSFLLSFGFPYSSASISLSLSCVERYSGILSLSSF